MKIIKDYEIEVVMNEVVMKIKEIEVCFNCKWEEELKVM